MVADADLARHRPERGRLVARLAFDDPRLAAGAPARELDGVPTRLWLSVGAWAAVPEPSTSNGAAQVDTPNGRLTP